MTRLNNYLINESRSTVINEEDIPDFLNTNCAQALKQYKSSGVCIYRGLKNENISVLTDPTKGRPRHSIDISNYYTLLIDNLPSWKKYPKRSRSIIGATDAQTAYDYGTNNYIVFPFDNVKIGVCSRIDIWYSFHNTVGNLRALTQNLEMLFIKTTNMKNFDKDWKLLTKTFKESEKFAKNNPEEFNVILKKIGFLHSNEFYEILHKPYIEVLNYYMDPNLNEFRLFTPKDSLKSASHNEVWVGGKSLLVQDEYLYDLKNNKDI